MQNRNKMNIDTKSVEQIDALSDEYEIHKKDGIVKDSIKAKEDTKTNDIDYILENIRWAWYCLHFSFLYNKEW